MDSNVFVYANDKDAGEKTAKARTLLLALADANAMSVSAQVVNETYYALVRKLRLDPGAAWQIVSHMGKFEIVPLTFELAHEGAQIATKAKINFWDGLILAAASSAGCKTLYTEDLAHGQKIAGVKVVDPFA